MCVFRPLCPCSESKLAVWICCLYLVTLKMSHNESCSGYTDDLLVWLRVSDLVPVVIFNCAHVSVVIPQECVCVPMDSTCQWNHSGKKVFQLVLFYWRRSAAPSLPLSCHLWVMRLCSGPEQTARLRTHAQTDAQTRAAVSADEYSQWTVRAATHAVLVVIKVMNLITGRSYCSLCPNPWRPEANSNEWEECGLGVRETQICCVWESIVRSIWIWWSV